MKIQKPDLPVISIKQNLKAQESIDIIDEAEESNIFSLLANLNNLGLLNSIIALAATRKISPQQVIELCQFLPQKVIEKKVALAAINQRRKT